MRLSVLAVGRLPRGPETALVSDYLSRADAAGRALGLSPVELLEVDGRRRGREAEAEALLAALSPGDEVFAMDERGEALSSRAFAGRVADLRDRGARRTVFLLGGPDGLAPAARGRARHALAFGPWTWPHALARVMLSEQIYRAVSILAGAPYHRD